MSYKITGSTAFIEKVKQTFDPNQEALSQVTFIESRFSTIDISCSLEGLEHLIEVLTFLQPKGITLSGKTAKGEVWFLASDIYLIEAFGNDVETILFKQKIILDKKLYEYEEMLAKEGFVRIGKSVLVNTNKIESVASAYNGKLLLYLENNDKVYVNRSYNKHFKQVLKQKRG